MELFQPPEGNKPPPPLIRAILIFTCTGVSFAHGSNDGQKGMGLIMLILIGIVPLAYSLNKESRPKPTFTIVSNSFLQQTAACDLSKDYKDIPDEKARHDYY